MGGFKRALLGYRRAEVDAAMAARDARLTEVDAELCGLSEMVLGREREITGLRHELEAAGERHERSLRSLELITGRLEVIHAQARGQATRIRMKALAEAVEVSERVQDLSKRMEPGVIGEKAAAPGDGGGAPDAEPADGGSVPDAEPVWAGRVEVELGPLADFSQLLGFQEAVEEIEDVGGVSLERFSEGRATLSLQLNRPVELLARLQERSPLELGVRTKTADRLVLDLAGGARSGQRAA